MEWDGNLKSYNHSYFIPITDFKTTIISKQNLLNKG